MANKDYNPLNEGYTGGSTGQRGYTGSESSTTQAPATIPNVQSGVVKPIDPHTSTSVTTQNNDK